MSLIIASTNEGCADPVDLAVFTAADFNGKSFDGAAFVRTPGVAERLEGLLKGGKLVLDSAGCYDYARWKLTYGDNEDQTMILGPGDGIVFTNNGKYFGITEPGIALLLNVVPQ